MLYYFYKIKGIVMDLFSNNLKQYAPLPERMRPITIEGFIGQTNILY